MTQHEHQEAAQSENTALRQQVAHELHEILKIPGNALNLSIMVAQQNLAALKSMQQEAERRYARPVLVRVEYEGSVRATVQERDEEGLLSVVLEERKDGEWTTTSIDPTWHKVLSDMVLSQTAQPGDIWFITNNATVENALEKAAGFFDEKIRHQATEQAS